MTNALMHRRSRIAGAVNPDFKQLFHFQYNGSGWYPGPNIMSFYMGTEPIYADWGDGTSGLMAAGRDYPDGSTKTITLYSAEGLWGLVKARFSWEAVLGPIPFFHNMPNLKWIEADNCFFVDGALHNFDDNPSLESMAIFSGPAMTGSLPSFSHNTLLKSLNFYGLNFSGTVPDFSACTILEDVYLGGGQSTTGYVHGSFNTQPNLYRLGFWNHYWPQSEVDSLLHELVTYSLPLGSRVACEVQLHGSNMAVPNAQGYIDKGVLNAAGWSVYTE